MKATLSKRKCEIMIQFENKTEEVDWYRTKQNSSTDMRPGINPTAELSDSLTRAFGFLTTASLITLFRLFLI